MKRSNRPLFSLAALLAMTATAAMAQPPERPGPPGIEMIMQGLQRAERDLKLSEEVAGKLVKLREEFQAALQKEMRDAGINPRGPEPEQRDTYVKIRGKLAGEFNPKAAALLSPDQLKRLRQIDLQNWLKSSAPRALLAPDVVGELKLTDDQRQTLSALDSQFMAKRLEAGFNPAEYNDKAIKVLTDEQKETLNKLKGADLPSRASLNNEEALAELRKQVPPFWEQSPSVFKVHFAALLAVQRDLAVSEEVARKLSLLRDEYRATYRKECQAADLFQSPGQVPLSQRKQLQGVMRKMDDEFIPKVDELLSADQQKRFQQILFQYLLKDRGPLALVAVASELKLSDEQQQKLTALDRELSPRPPGPKGRVPAPPRPGPMAKGREAAENRLLKVREYSTKAVEVLSAEQKATFETLKGSEFDLDQLVIRGRTRDT